MIYVTHDQIEALTLADRIAVMHAGVIQQLDTPHEIYHRPANRFVAGFVGSPAMNFRSGAAMQRRRARAFESEGIRLPLAGYPWLNGGRRRAAESSSASGRSISCRRTAAASRRTRPRSRSSSRWARRRWSGAASPAQPLSRPRRRRQPRSRPASGCRSAFPPERLNLFDAATGVASLAGASHLNVLDRLSFQLYSARKFPPLDSAARDARRRSAIPRSSPMAACSPSPRR